MGSRNGRIPCDRLSNALGDLMNQHIQEVLAVVGALYTLLSVLGNLAPKTAFGRFCAKAALVLRNVEGQAK